METNINATEINLAVELARGNVKARDLLNLSVGSIVPLMTSPEEEAIIRVEGVPKYKGYVGSFKGSRAIKLSQPIQDVES